MTGEHHFVHFGGGGGVEMWVYGVGGCAGVQRGIRCGCMVWEGVWKGSERRFGACNTTLKLQTLQRGI